jgi:hypothetical protein
MRYCVAAIGVLFSILILLLIVATLILSVFPELGQVPGFTLPAVVAY